MAWMRVSSSSGQNKIPISRTKNAREMGHPSARYIPVSLNDWSTVLVSFGATVTF
jgi:hypothetical protein